MKPLSKPLSCLVAVCACIITVCFFTAGQAIAQAPKLTFKHISIEQGLSNSTIETIFQDSRGFMWFGTRDGLNRFDGNGITIYRNDPKDSTTISDNYISSIFEDKRHNLWIGTISGLNCYEPDRNSFTRYRHQPGNDNSISNNYITAICANNNNSLWVSTNGGGVNMFNLQTRHFSSNTRHIPVSNVTCMLTDGQHNLWLGTRNGLAFYNPVSGAFRLYGQAGGNPRLNVIVAMQQDNKGILWLGTEDSGLMLFNPADKSFTQLKHNDSDAASLSSNMIKCLLADARGNIWVGTLNGGLEKYDAATKGFIHYQNQPQNPLSLSQRTVSALFTDRQNNLWVGTHRGGINLYTPNAEKFRLYQQEPWGNSLSYNDVKAFCEDLDGNIWIGTDGGGLDMFNRRANSFKHYRYNPYDAATIGADAVLDVMQDSRANIWVSTWGGGLNLLNKQTGRFTRFLNNQGDKNSITSNKVQKVFEDSRRNLWVATYYGGLNLYDRDKHTFTRVTCDGKHKTCLQGNNIISINEDKEGNLWIGTDDGGLNCYNPHTDSFSHYFNDGDKMPDLRVIFIDHEGRVWVGQNGLYLFDATHGRFDRYTDKGGLATEFIKGIVEDDKGNFWIATSNGITQFNPQTRYVKKYNTADGLQGLEFEANSYLKTRDGAIFFGGVNGFNTFYPNNIVINKFVPPVYITDFQIFNKKVIPGAADSPLQKDISLTDKINLTYKQSDISFNYASLNYTAADNNQYAYKLDGFDKVWNYVGNQHKANYTNLDPGTYVFRVKASNNDGVWNERGASLTIVISSPYWKTWWFMVLVVLVVVGSTYYVLSLKRNLEIRKLEEQKREEMHQLQLQFFTNISHEFRTPLSLIMGPLELLSKDEQRPGFLHYYQTMQRNANRLMGLINELMDFRKVESGVLRLRAMAGNPNVFITEIADEFYDAALEKGISLEVTTAPDVSEAWFDRQIIEKIILNLLNNAFKYTPNNGRISLGVLTSITELKPLYPNEMVLESGYRAKNYIYFRVTDTGIGISKPSLQHLFERYYRITDAHMGSGVGLAFVKSLTHLHKGKIYVYSQKEEGTDIIIAIPAAAEDYDKNERWMKDAGVQLESMQYTVPESIAADTDGVAIAPKIAADPTKHILVVDDNNELRNFLVDSLSPYFKVSAAGNGRRALEQIKTLVPDLIISDVMMPVIDGNEFCRIVKQDAAMSHIPFLMLTAKSAPQANIEGMGSGADFYFAKPISISLLLLTINNIFAHSQKLKDRFTSSQYTEAREQAHAVKDKEFVDKLVQLIESQLTNPDLDVDYLCGELNMGRTKLYEKIKALSGQSIIEFIRSVRLRNAARIMTQEDVSLTEVMYRVGIQTQSYFTKAFKKEFNKTPSQFLSEIDRKNNK